jgi:DNA-binding XRE family transcriptional regulator
MEHAVLRLSTYSINFIGYNNYHYWTPPNALKFRPPLPVKRALAKLGQDIRNARVRRRITTTIMAERAFITRPTLRKVEKGDPGVSLGIYATVVFVLGLTTRLADLVDARADDVGLALEEERLPKRSVCPAPGGGSRHERP